MWQRQQTYVIMRYSYLNQKGKDVSFIERWGYNEEQKSAYSNVFQLISHQGNIWPFECQKVPVLSSVSSSIL